MLVCTKYIHSNEGDGLASKRADAMPPLYETTIQYRRLTV